MYVSRSVSETLGADRIDLKASRFGLPPPSETVSAGNYFTYYNGNVLILSLNQFLLVNFQLILLILHHHVYWEEGGTKQSSDKAKNKQSIAHEQERQNETDKTRRLVEQRSQYPRKKQQQPVFITQTTQHNKTQI